MHQRRSELQKVRVVIRLPFEQVLMYLKNRVEEVQGEEEIDEDQFKRGEKCIEYCICV